MEELSSHWPLVWSLTFLLLAACALLQIRVFNCTYTQYCFKGERFDMDAQSPVFCALKITWTPVSMVTDTTSEPNQVLVIFTDKTNRKTIRLLRNLSLLPESYISFNPQLMVCSKGCCAYTQPWLNTKILPLLSYYNARNTKNNSLKSFMPLKIDRGRDLTLLCIPTDFTM